MHATDKMIDGYNTSVRVRQTLDEARIAAKKAEKRSRAAERKGIVQATTEIRQAARAERSDIQQLAELLRRPGNSVKEAGRLFWRIIESRPTQGWTKQEKEVLTATAERIFPEGDDFVLAA
ncbi:MAG: hypothetical protein WBP12_02370 [Candidatus Saccharimonas sp.]